MALVLSDRIKETSSTTGTGTLTLGGAVTGFETFTANLSNSDTTYYCCTDNINFEVGLGTFTSSGTTLARTTILASSNSNNAVNWSSGTRTVFCTMPAAKSVFLDASGNLNLSADLSVGDDLTILGGLLDLKSNSGSPSQIKFYCESSNAHAQTLTAQVHSVGATNTLTLPAGGNSTLVSESQTQTLTNKTLTTPVIAEIDSSADITLDAGADIVLDAAGGNIEFKDAGTLQLIIDMDGTAGAQVIQLAVDSDDLIFKQYDGTTVLTLDDDTTVKVAADLTVGDDLTVNGGVIDLKTNSGAVAKLKFYCESGNAHAQTLQAQPHSASASDVLTLPTGGDSTLISRISTDTLTNKTLTSPKINEDVAVTSTATELNLLDGVTATTAELNFNDTGVSVGTVAASKTVTVDANKDVTSFRNLTASGAITAGSFVIGSADINENDLEAIDGVTAGTIAASKAAIVDANKDITGFRNITLTGELDAGSLDISGNADIDGTLEADAMTLNGTAITATATLSTGISNNNVPKFTSGVADDDFLRVAGTAIEGRSASEVLSDIGATTAALAADEATALAIALG